MSLDRTAKARPGRTTNGKRPDVEKTGAVELLVLSLAKAEEYEPRGVEICISITDPKAPPAKLSPAFAAVLRLGFNDIAGPGAPTDVLFGAEQATAIRDFLEQWPHVDRIVVHCQAGVSRSPGVALGLCDLRGWPTLALEETYPAWNTWVRKTLAACPARRTGA